MDGPRGRVAAYCVALDWPSRASLARVHALRALANIVEREHEGRRLPLIIAGDLNAPPDSDEVRMLTGRTATATDTFVLFDAWEMAGRQESDGATWSNSNLWAGPNLVPNRRIDYIFAGWPRKGGVGSVISAKRHGTVPQNGIFGSDHFAVTADIRY